MSFEPFLIMVGSEAPNRNIPGVESLWHKALFAEIVRQVNEAVGPRARIMIVDKKMRLPSAGGRAEMRFDCLVQPSGNTAVTLH